MIDLGSFGIADPRSFYIDGRRVASTSGRTFDLVQAHTEEVYLSVAEAGEDEANQAVAAARRAFDHGPWPRMTPAERAPYLHRLADGIRKRADHFADAWVNETGVLRSIAAAGTAGGATRFDYYANLASTFAFVDRRTPSMGGGTAYLVHEPVGVVLAIVPWNAPLTTLSVKIAPALLAGCTVILKNSPEAPLEGLMIAEIADEIGLPPGVLNVLTADRAVSERLVRNEAVDKVSLTGSSAAGRKVGAICGERIARCTLELGGKSAAIVREDFDVERVAAALAASTPRISGQVCAALTRVIVPRGRHDALVEAMASAFGAIRVGDPFDDATGLGPLAMSRQLARVEDYVRIARDEGATVATGGSRPAGLKRGWFIEPTVFGGVDNTMRVAREEIFGPVVSVIPSDSDEQAIEIANDSEFGLNSAVFTDDLEAAWSIGRRLRAGTVGHNSLRLDMDLAFGGFKRSGIGREGGVEGLLPYLESKTMLMSGDVAGA